MSEHTQGAEKAAVVLTPEQVRRLERIEDGGETQGLAHLVNEIVRERLAPFGALDARLLRWGRNAGTWGSAYDDGRAKGIYEAQQALHALLNPSGERGNGSDR